MELACESVDFEDLLYRETKDRKVLNAGEPTKWIDLNNGLKVVVPATSMEVTKHKTKCSIVVYGQVLVTAPYKSRDDKVGFDQLPGMFVHSVEPFDGVQTHEWFMTAPYKN